MKNKNLVVCIALSTGLLFTNHAVAQEVHIVKMRESLSTIAHKYHVTVGDLMRYNGLNAKSKLQIGERIKIPTKSNHTKETVKQEIKLKHVEKVNVGRVTSVEPAKTHIVEQGESLFRIAKNCKVPIAKLREWNNIQDYTITVGQELFISKPSEDEIKAMQPAKTTTVKTFPETVVVEKEKPVNVVKQMDETKLVDKKAETVDPVIPVVSQQIKVTAENNEPVNVVKTISTQSTVESTKSPIVKSKTNSATDQGYFASQFVSSQQEITGTAGILKTSSGWLDKKYYVLMNNVAPGTIIKITVNNNIVYAKVLEALPDIKEDQGLILRVSNAAASALNISDSKFQVTVNY